MKILTLPQSMSRLHTLASFFRGRRRKPTRVILFSYLSTGNCIAVTFSTCSSRGFKWTVFPNLVGLDTLLQAEVGFTRATRDVMNQVCQEAALTYMCALYFPQCDPNTGLPKFPCQSLCLGKSLKSQQNCVCEVSVSFFVGLFLLFLFLCV